jgi:hypothetical protein
MNIPVLLPILLSWAVHLSDYPMPPQAPEIEFVPHTFFVEHACGGRECSVLGWYDDRNVIYLDEKYASIDDTFAHSLLVHELVHYLQHRGGQFDPLSCEQSQYREREAYHVQNQYIAQAEASIDLIKPAPTFCNY